jgi:transposase-like protein
MSKKKKNKLTPEMIKIAAKLIEEGNYISHVAQALGIERRTFYTWLEQGKKATHGLKREFYEAVTQAEAKAVLRNIKIIQKAAETNWQAAAWWLERKFPEEFGRKDRINFGTDEDGLKIVIEKVVKKVDGKENSSNR